MDEYAEAVRRFYEVYRPIARRHNLRLHSKFSLHDDGFIKIYQGEGSDNTGKDEKRRHCDPIQHTHTGPSHTHTIHADPELVQRDVGESTESRNEYATETTE